MNTIEFPNLLDVAMYPPVLTSRLVELRPERVRRWLRGYEYHSGRSNERRGVKKRQSPVIHRHTTEGEPYASFLDLVDLLFVKNFLAKGLSLQRLRLALNEAEEVLQGRRFAHRDFWTDGRRIYVQVKKHPGNLLQLLSGGQWVIKDIIVHFAEQIDFDRTSGFAERWYPLGRSEPIILDPSIAFGAPTILNRGTRTDNVYDFFVAENEDIARTRQWFELSEREVCSAVAFERKIAA